MKLRWRRSKRQGDELRVKSEPVQVTIHAESEKGFDKAKLQNGVMEPLREADLIE
jgi:hypothetical protein